MVQAVAGTLTLPKLSARVHDRLTNADPPYKKLNEKEILALIRLTFAHILDAVSHGEIVSIRHFGKFMAHELKRKTVHGSLPGRVGLYETKAHYRVKLRPSAHANRAVDTNLAELKRLTKLAVTSVELSAVSKK